MRRLTQLTYDHRVVIHRFGDPPMSRVVRATAPLAGHGIRAVVHWQDAGGDRYAFIASRGSTVDYEGDLLGEVGVAVVGGSTPVPRRWQISRPRPTVTRYVTSALPVGRPTR